MDVHDQKSKRSSLCPQDIIMMSRAACLVTSRSGFSNLAKWMGRVQHHNLSDDCVSSLWVLDLPP